MSGRRLLPLQASLDTNRTQVDLHARLAELTLQATRTSARLLRDHWSQIRRELGWSWECRVTDPAEAEDTAGAEQQVPPDLTNRE